LDKLNTSDNNSDTYDTSEKARIPAWTDRVLFRGPASLKAYDRAELRSSDHRPVYAVLDVEVREVDQGRKARITREISGGLQGEIGGLSHFDGGSQASEKAVSGGKAGTLSSSEALELPACLSGQQSRWGRNWETAKNPSLRQSADWPQ
jgi:hypothetical protein